ncbi:MAG: HAMP domain-containing sensor histidine kinase [Vicinamibacterales bacterium]
MMTAGVRYRSLYWRIGIGFVLCVAALLTVQGLVLLWLVNQEEADARTTFTLPLATTLGEALSAQPTLDIRTFVKERATDAPRSFYVVMQTGDDYLFGPQQPLASALRAVHEQLDNDGVNRIPFYWQTAPYWASPVYVNGALRGIVSVVARDHVKELWPPMTLLAAALLVVGTITASWFIFGPAHRRLVALETAARRLGSGDTTARASEEGGDEVASLARTFNTMASDLAARSSELLESDRTRRLLLADISHELMTPLTAIRGYQEKLSTDPFIAASHAHRRYVGIIGEEALRVERIVRDLLDLARFESGGNVLDIQDVSLEGLFGRVAARQEPEASRRNIRLDTTIEPGAELMHGDPFRLEQALQNLAANALRHVPPGGSIGLHGAIDGREVVIRVTDTGTGIAAAHLPFLFDRFYKVESSRAASAEGSGLGLSIVRAIIERHGGRIDVQSEEGVGTTFTVRLPASEDAADDGGLRRGQGAA